MKASPCYVYIVQYSDGMLYTGITNSLTKRVNEHNLGIKTCLQKSRRPVSLVYWEEHVTRIDAAKKERQIKNRNRKYKLELIKKFSLH